MTYFSQIITKDNKNIDQIILYQESFFFFLFLLSFFYLFVSIILENIFAPIDNHMLYITHLNTLKKEKLILHSGPKSSWHQEAAVAKKRKHINQSHPQTMGIIDASQILSNH